jgi:hypothetical protein
MMGSGDVYRLRAADMLAQARQSPAVGPDLPPIIKGGRSNRHRSSNRLCNKST